MSDLKPGIAAFLADPGVQAALSGPRAASASPALLDEFFRDFSYDSCSPDQLLTLSDLALRCRNQQVAADALLHVIATGARLPLAQYRLGRLRLSQGDPAAAAEHFDVGVSANAAFPFNHMGAARARHALGQAEAAARHAIQFAALDVRPHGPEDLGVLAELADFLFDAGKRDDALPIYALVHRFGTPKPRHVVRLAEGRMAAGDVSQARAMLLQQAARTGEDPWISRALATCYSQAGEHDAAIAAATRAVQADPANPGFVGTLVRVVGKSGDPVLIRHAMAAHTAILSMADSIELAARLHIAEARLDDAASLLVAASFGPESRLYHLAIETAYAAVAAGALALATTVWDRLRALAPDDVTLKILRIEILFRDLAWEDAGAILHTLPSGSEERPQVTMKRLEYACFAADQSAATQAAARLEALAPTSGRQLMLPVFRFLAEQHDWQGVVDRALPWLDTSLNYRQIGYVLFRAARHTRRQADMLAAIHAIPDWARQDGLRTLRNALAVDCVAHAADAEALLRDEAVLQDVWLARKLATQREVLARAEGAGARDAVFLCTDLAYLCPTIVVLHGLARFAARGRVAFFLVCEDAIADLARRAVQAFTAAGTNIEIVPASEIIRSADRLSASYGLFTSGHTLSSAAYYRIYFAAHLQASGRFGRALYVDSDVLPTGNLPDLLAMAGSFAPLTARLETPRPDVRRAIAHHGLTDGQYFNSGVLLFDFSHPDLEPGLHAAMAAVADPGVALLYHDQCALNLGFRGRFAALDIEWNYPVTETTKLAEIPPGVGLLHFLDRPKPWSAAYQGEAGPLWFDRWRETASFIGEDVATELLGSRQD